MKYEIILEKGEYALILRGSRMEEYAVVNGLNKKLANGVGLAAITILEIIRRLIKHKHCPLHLIISA